MHVFQHVSNRSASKMSSSFSLFVGMIDTKVKPVRYAPQKQKDTTGHNSSIGLNYQVHRVSFVWLFQVRLWLALSKGAHGKTVFSAKTTTERHPGRNLSSQPWIGSQHVRLCIGMHTGIQANKKGGGWGKVRSQFIAPLWFH